MVRFSSRIAFDISANRLSVALNRKRASGERILDLTESNPTTAGLQYPQEAICEALGDARGLAYHPTPQGLQEARSAISGYYHGRVLPERILLTASTSEAYSYAFKLLCDPGDEVLVPRPSYPLFEYLAALECVRVVQYPLRYDYGWSIDTQELRGLVTPRTRAVAFVNPNNPTGSFLKRSEYREVVNLCRQHSLVILCDEVFADYAFDGDPERMPTLTGTTDVLTLCLSGLSKVSGLPQMKLGWIAAAGPDREAERALQGLELIADTFLSVASPVQYASHALLAIRVSMQEQILGLARRNLALLRQRTSNTPLRVLRAEGGWYATVQVPRIRSEEDWVVELLERHNVLVQPGFFYDFDAEAFLVLSLLTPEADFAQGVETLCSTV